MGGLPTRWPDRLGEALASASTHLLLLSATPHQGKTDQFRRLMALLDPDAFVEDSDICKEKVTLSALKNATPSTPMVTPCSSPDTCSYGRFPGALKTLNNGCFMME